jgi:hypothetical protein
MSAYEKIKEQIPSDRKLEQDITAIRQKLYDQVAVA